jgi:Ca2+-binding EF-hand superfamily protein
LPGILAERVYSRYDKSGKGYIAAKEFVETSIFFFSPSFDDKVKIVFELIDFNNDGKIEVEDIQTLMSHMPLQKMVRNACES